MLSTFVGKHPTPYLDKFTEPGGQFNDTEVGLRKGRTMPEVLDEFNDAHARVMSLAAQIPPESFRHNGTLPWYGMEFPSKPISIDLPCASWQAHGSFSFPL